MSHFSLLVLGADHASQVERARRLRGWDYAELTHGLFRLLDGRRSLEPNALISDMDYVKVLAVHDELIRTGELLPNGKERLAKLDSAAFLRSRVFDADVALVSDLDWVFLDGLQRKESLSDWDFDERIRSLSESGTSWLSRALPGESMEEFLLRRSLWHVGSVLLLGRVFSMDHPPGFWLGELEGAVPETERALFTDRFALEERSLLESLPPKTPVALYHVSS